MVVYCVQKAVRFRDINSGGLPGKGLFNYSLAGSPPWGNWLLTADIACHLEHVVGNRDAAGVQFIDSLGGDQVNQFVDN